MNHSCRCRPSVVEKSISCWHHLACLYKFSHIFYLILPILEGKVDVISEFFDNFLCDWRIADNFNFLGIKIVNSASDALNLLKISGFFISSMESNECFQNFISNKTYFLLFDFSFKFFNMTLNFSIVFFHRLVKTEDRFSNFFFEIREKSFNNC